MAVSLTSKTKKEKLLPRSFALKQLLGGVLPVVLLAFIFLLWPTPTFAACSITDPWACVTAVGGFATGAITSALTWIVFLFVQVALFFLYVAGSVFNIALSEMVFEYAVNFGNSPAVLAGWGILRDFGNIFLLFGFIFLGITTILNLENYNAKKTLVRLLFFALTLNFSLLAAEAIIDTSNVASYVLYNQASVTACPSGNPEQCAQTGLAERIISTTGIGFGIQNAPSVTFSGNEGFQRLSATVAILFFICILMTVLFAAAILFIIRAIVLTLLIVTAPLGFAGMVIPYLSGLAKDWWDQLIKQSFFAPIYLLLLLVSLKIIEGLTENITGGRSLYDAMMNPNGSVLGVVVIFILSVAFLLATQILAKKMGAHGSEMAFGAAGKATGFLSFGVPALAARNAARFGAGIASRAGITTKRISLLPILGARFAATQLDKMATKSLDPRGISQLGSIAKGLPSGTAMDFGKTGRITQGGYRAVREDKERRDMEGFGRAGRGGPNEEETQRLRAHDQTLEGIQRDILAAIRAGGPHMAATVAGLQATRDAVLQQRQTIQDGIDARNQVDQYTYMRNTRWASYIPLLYDTEAKRNAERQMSNHLTRSELRRFLDDLAGALPGAATRPTPPAAATP